MWPGLVLGELWPRPSSDGPAAVRHDRDVHGGVGRDAGPRPGGSAARTAASWCSGRAVQKLGASAAMGIGVRRGLYARRALAVAGFDFASGLGCLAYARQLGARGTAAARDVPAARDGGTRRPGGGAAVPRPGRAAGCASPTRPASSPRSSRRGCGSTTSTGPPGGTMNLSMLLSGLDAEEICQRWRTLAPASLRSRAAAGAPTARCAGRRSAARDGLREQVFPHLGIDPALIRRAAGVIGTYNVCNFADQDRGGGGAPGRRHGPAGRRGVPAGPDAGRGALRHALHRRGLDPRQQRPGGGGQGKRRASGWSGASATPPPTTTGCSVSTST